MRLKLKSRSNEKFKSISSLILLILLLLSSSAFAFQPDIIHVCFSPRGGCTENIVDQINAAKTESFIQAYSFTSDEIAKAIAFNPLTLITSDSTPKTSNRTETFYLVDAPETPKGGFLGIGATKPEPGIILADEPVQEESDMLHHTIIAPLFELISKKSFIILMIIGVTGIILTCLFYQNRRYKNITEFPWSVKVRKAPVIVTAAFLFPIIIMIIAFRYENDQIGNRLIRYDRFTSQVEWKNAYNKDAKWRTLRFKSMGQAKAAFQKQEIEESVEKAKQELKNEYDRKESDKEFEESIRISEERSQRDMKELLDDMAREKTEYKLREQQNRIDDLESKLQRTKQGR